MTFITLAYIFFFLSRQWAVRRGILNGKIIIILTVHVTILLLVANRYTIILLTRMYIKNIWCSVPTTYGFLWPPLPPSWIPKMSKLTLIACWLLEGGPKIQHFMRGRAGVGTFHKPLPRDFSNYSKFGCLANFKTSLAPIYGDPTINTFNRKNALNLWWGAGGVRTCLDGRILNCFTFIHTNI